MPVRYLPYKPFATRVNGVRYVFVPDYQENGAPGYAELPKGLGKETLASFYEIEVPGEPVVEQASAAPGEKRSVTKKKKSAKPGEDAVAKSKSVEEPK